MKKYLIFWLLCFSICVCAEAQGSVYSTWDTVEIDTCASAWLIKNFVDKEAQFRFYPKGEIITEGIPFDTPDAELRRTDNMSTFECVMKKFKINDPALKQIGEIIHDIEINYWGRKIKQESEELNKTIREIIDTSKNNQEKLQKSFPVFDNLYEKFKNVKFIQQK